MPVASLDQVQYRSLRVGEGSAVVSFLRECGYDPNERSWSWINRESPHGPALVELAWAQGRVVGHYGVLPRAVQMEDKVVHAGLAIHAAVHPQFRGLVILQELLGRMIERCRLEQIQFIYGFPRRDVWLLYSRLFDWKLMGELVTLELPVPAFPGGEGSGQKIRLVKRAVFDERYEPLDGSEVLAGLNHVRKDAEFARWRYAHHPKVDYSLLELLGEKGGLLGYLVLKLYEKEGRRYGHLVDLALRREAISSFQEWVSAALQWFAERGVGTASCWMLRNSPYFTALDRMGFQPAGFTTYVGYRLVDPNFPVEKLRLDAWHMVMGDSDAF